MENIKQKIDFIRIFHLPCNYTELNMKEISQYYDCSIQLLLVAWTVCQCTPCTHILNAGRNYSIFCLSLCQTNTTHSTPFTVVFRHNCRELIVSKPHPLFSRSRSMSITLHYQPFLLNTVSTFPFPHSAGTDILNDFVSINKALYFIISVFSIPCFLAVNLSVKQTSLVLSNYSHNMLP